MVIIKTTQCPRCQHSVRVSVRQLPKGLYGVVFYDGRDKNARNPISECPYCKTNLFQSGILKTMTGLEPAQLSR